MCILCFGLAGEDHWSQALGDEGARARRRRRELAAAVLSAHGLTLKGDVGGLADVVGDRKGRCEVVRGLGELWPAAQRLSGAPLDPLDPSLLDRLTAVGGRPVIEVTILSGFLGSGKTTLLRHGLGDAADPATAVIVNEFGEAGLDDRLVRVVAEHPVLVAGGCVCCARRPDLVHALAGLLDDRDAGRRPLARVVIECSGLADPAPIAFTIATDPMLRHHFTVTRTVVAVDAVNGAAQLNGQPECAKQAHVADELVITKVDLAGTEQVRALAGTLRAANPAAVIRTARDGHVAPEPLDEPAATRPPAAGGPAANARETAVHAGDVASLTIARERPLDWMAFSVWLSMLLHARGEDVLRVKGVLGLPGGDAVSVNGVQHIVHPPEHVPADVAAGPRATRLVVIARGIEPEAIERSFDVFQALSTRAQAVAA